MHAVLGTLRNYSQVHNKRGIKMNGGGFKDFEKLLKGGWGSKQTGVGTKYIIIREETNIALSLNTLLTSLNIDISSILRSCLH